MNLSEKNEARGPPSATQITDKNLPVQQKKPDSPGPSCLSFKSDRSMGLPLEFKEAVQITDGTHYTGQRGDQERPEVIISQDLLEHQTDLTSILMLLKQKMFDFVENELKMYELVLQPDYSDSSERQREDEEVMGRGALLNITLHLLRSMKQEGLANKLESILRVSQDALCQQKLKSNMKNKFQCLYEGISKPGKSLLLKDIYTDLYITEGEGAEVNNEHEVIQIETTSRKLERGESSIKCEEILKPLPGQAKPIRTLMTKGVAGIGKTVLTHKFTLDWAEDKANEDIYFTFPLTFRELNLVKGKICSFVELIHHFFSETKEAGICSYDKFRVVFILDGLDECRLPLDFQNNEVWTDVTESNSVDVLLTNLIKGELLPNAQIWITTRPAAAHQIPPECVDIVTEVRGFTDLQKEEYFRKRFRDERQATRIISHIKASRSLHIMCHIPVFCWITAMVLEHVVSTDERGELPKTLTDMYIHFLVVQSLKANVKYQGRAGTEPLWNRNSKEIILSLGKLAFEQLEKGNLIFYETDLAECCIDIKAASVYSGVFTEIFREECGLHHDRVFSFVHLSIQEFLAAVYVHFRFINNGVNLLSKTQTTFKGRLLTKQKSKPKFLHKSAVGHALQSQNGHLDLFLRFLLGLSLESNKTLLQGLLEPDKAQTRHSSQTNQETVKYIKKMIRENSSPEKSINLFHCLNELKDHSLLEEIQMYLRSGNIYKDKLSPTQWSALVFILLSSEKELDMFDLKKYSSSDEGLLRLLPVLKTANIALLSECNLSERSCKGLASVISSESSSVRELDLTNNDLHDSGVKVLSAGLGNPHCRLETLRLSGCQITETGCAYLTSALKSNPSYLRELDLSYNHPGDSGVILLSTGLEDPRWKLERLSVAYGGVWMLKPGLRKYATGLTLDPNTAHRSLSLSEGNRKVTEVGEKQPYPDHPDRFGHWEQILGTEGLTGRCYWEIEWKIQVEIGVTYKGIKRKGENESRLGRNDKSWSLECSENGYTAWHRQTDTHLSHTAISNRVGVYLDWPGGILSFFRASSDTLRHLHTFHATFTEPLYPGVGFGAGLGFGVGLFLSGSSASLCQIE